jgi:hypothetical protein
MELLDGEDLAMFVARRGALPRSEAFAIFAPIAHALGTAPVGTMAWMAPEQADEHGAIGPHTDVWALGLIVFFLLTAKTFWPSDASFSVLAKKLLIDPMRHPRSGRALRGCSDGAYRAREAARTECGKCADGGRARADRAGGWSGTRGDPRSRRGGLCNSISSGYERSEPIAFRTWPSRRRGGSGGAARRDEHVSSAARRSNS